MIYTSLFCQVVFFSATDLWAPDVGEVERENKYPFSYHSQPHPKTQAKGRGVVRGWKDLYEHLPAR